MDEKWRELRRSSRRWEGYGVCSTLRIPNQSPAEAGLIRKRRNNGMNEKRRGLVGVPAAARDMEFVLLSVSRIKAQRKRV